MKQRANRTFARKQTPENYVFDYPAEVERFEREFPARAGRIHFVDMTPTSAKALSSVFNDVAKVQEEVDHGVVSNAIILMQGKGQSFTIKYRDQQFVVVDRAGARKGLPKLMGAAASNDLENLNTIDHEIGHRVTREGLGENVPQNLSECAADAYAALRYAQRFDDVSKLSEFADMRAIELVFRADDGDHFTSPVLDAIAAKTFSRGVLKSLSPDDTAEVALALARAKSVGVEKLVELRGAFSGYVSKLPDVAAGNMEPLRDLALDLLTTGNADAYKWGKRAFDAILDGKAAVNGVTIRPEGAEWVELRAEIAARASEFAPKKPSLPPAPK